jgi:hypothetical protein
VTHEVGHVAGDEQRGPRPEDEKRPAPATTDGEGPRGEEEQDDRGQPGAPDEAVACGRGRSLYQRSSSSAPAMTSRWISLVPS